mmetsp:Transcript_28399/g.59374  ORF Transcript_28399/g.59374 Transcript_28399/m.59374 type:complete len:276 (-) Transcript_28399:248-1075(-)
MLAVFILLLIFVVAFILPVVLIILVTFVDAFILVVTLDLRLICAAFIVFFVRMVFGRVSATITSRLFARSSIDCCRFSRSFSCCCEMAVWDFEAWKVVAGAQSYQKPRDIFVRYSVRYHIGMYRSLVPFLSTFEKEFMSHGHRTILSHNPTAAFKFLPFGSTISHVAISLYHCPEFFRRIQKDCNSLTRLFAVLFKCFVCISDNLHSVNLSFRLDESRCQDVTEFTEEFQKTQILLPILSYLTVAHNKRERCVEKQNGLLQSRMPRIRIWQCLHY